MYEILSGRPLCGDDDEPVATLLRIANEDVSVDDIPGSHEFRSVIRTALARDPADRYPDPAQMRRALLATPEAVRQAGPPGGW